MYVCILMFFFAHVVEDIEDHMAFREPACEANTSDGFTENNCLLLPFQNK